MSVPAKRAGAARAKPTPPWAAQVATCLLATAAIVAGPFALLLIGLAVLIVASQSPMALIMFYVLAAGLVAGAIAALCIALARGVWHGRRWARITLTSVMAALTPLFAWALTRPPNWGLDLFYSEWALGAAAAGASWLGSSSGDLRRSARAAASSPVRPAPPASARRAAALMRAGAALYGLLMIAEAVAMLSAGLKSWFVVAVMVVMSPGLATWMWMAAASNRGRPWARVVATVLFGAYTCCVVIGVLTGLAAPGGTVRTVSLTVSLSPPWWASSLIWLISYGVAAGATILLWRPQSTEFFQAVGQERRRSVSGS
ncbi:MAG TPA: hypothetical protein VLM11_03620 [Streptosporangiaceae bacterium]|nr:hypothetical protein [Streptosporangiaceae bacterium]